MQNEMYLEGTGYDYSKLLKASGIPKKALKPTLHNSSIARLCLQALFIPYYPRVVTILVFKRFSR